jgi:hypothetical protein
VALAFVATEAAAQRDLTPLQQATDMATSARRAGEPAERAASDIVAALRIASDDVVRALKGGGYAAEQTAPATTSALRMSVEQGLGLMLAIGYGQVESVRGFAAERGAVEPIVRALKGAGSSARQSTRDLFEAGVPRGDAVRYVSLVHALAAAEMAAELYALGMSATEAAAAMNEAGIALPLVVASLRDAGYAVGDIAVALRALTLDLVATARALLDAGFGIAEITLAFTQQLGESAAAIAAALLASDVVAVATMEALAQAGHALGDIASALLAAGTEQGPVANFVFAMAASLAEAIAILRANGWSALAAAQDAPPGQYPEAILIGLVQAGYHATQAANAVKDALGASPEQLAAGLRQAGQSASAAAAVLYEVYAGGVNMALETVIQTVAVNCFDPLQSAYELTPRQTFDAFHGSAPLQALFAWLASKGESAANAASWARERGERAHAIAVALDRGFHASVATVGQALQQAGFDAYQVCLALKDELEVEIAEYAVLLPVLGFDFAVLVEALMRVYNMTQLEVIANFPAGGG